MNNDIRDADLPSRATAAAAMGWPICTGYHAEEEDDQLGVVYNAIIDWERT